MHCLLSIFVDDSVLEEGTLEISRNALNDQGICLAPL